GERGEAISALFAAEAAIYGRFGYGLAAPDVRLTTPRGAKLRPVARPRDHSARLEALSAHPHPELGDPPPTDSRRRAPGVGLPPRVGDPRHPRDAPSPPRGPGAVPRWQGDPAHRDRRAGRRTPRLRDVPPRREVGGRRPAGHRAPERDRRARRRRDPRAVVG